MEDDPRSFCIKYMPRISIKDQVLTDLVAEFIESPMEEDKGKQLKGSSAWMKNQLMWFPCRSLYFGGYMLMIQQTKWDLEWG